MNNELAHRSPPHSTEAEESVIGSILLDNDAINPALEILTHEDFYNSAYKFIFQAMTAIVEKQEPIDVITVATNLKSLGYFEQSGGHQNLARLASLMPTSGNVIYYAKVVKAMSLRRKMIHEASGIIQDAFKLDSELEEFLDASELKILGVSDDKSKESFTPVCDIVQDSIKLIEILYDKKESITGISSGFTGLDNLTAGFQKSDLLIIAARPAMGKTSLALTVAQWVGIHEQKRVALFSLEMSKEQLVMRMLCSEARVDSTKVRTGNLDQSDFPKLVDAASKISDSPIYIDDTPALSISELRAKARRLHREAPLELVVVDYLQLLKSPAFKNSREQEISDISRSLKALAKELSIPVIALSQLNRSVEQRVDKRPLMSDLRESGAIEQDADIIMFIYRDEVYNDDTPDKGVAELIISKHRSGPTGIVRLAFNGAHTRFDNLEEHYDDLGGDDGSGDGISDAIDLSGFSDEFEGDLF